MRVCVCVCLCVYIYNICCFIFSSLFWLSSSVMRNLRLSSHLLPYFLEFCTIRSVHHSLFVFFSFASAFSSFVIYHCTITFNRKPWIHNSKTNDYYYALVAWWKFLPFLLAARIGRCFLHMCSPFCENRRTALGSCRLLAHRIPVLSSTGF